MQIVGISQEECAQFLQRVPLARLACSLDNQPYVVPVWFAYEPDSIFVFSTLGKKIAWMRQNPKVSLQADEIASRSNWTSVIVNGHYLELAEKQYPAEREHAMERLAQYAEWWMTPLAERREGTSDLAIEPIFFRIDIESMSGLRAVPEAK